MGWWLDKNNLEVGDDVLDLASHFLKDLSKIYIEALSRKPKLEELEAVLNLVWPLIGDSELFTDFDEKEIKQVIIKLGKRSKKVKLKIGDYFSFKITKDIYAFGVVQAKVSMGFVVTVLNYFSNVPIINQKILESKDWIAHPFVISSYTLFEDPVYDYDYSEWRILGSIANFVPNEKLNNVYFTYGDPQGTGQFILNALGEKIQLKDLEVDETELLPYTSYRDSKAQDLIRPFYQ